MRELKVCQFHGKSESTVRQELEKALDLTNYEDIFEIAKPFKDIDNWYAGFAYWESQPRLRAVC